jgi:hypothetical protein
MIDYPFNDKCPAVADIIDVNGPLMVQATVGFIHPTLLITDLYD